MKSITIENEHNVFSWTDLISSFKLKYKDKSIFIMTLTFVMGLLIVVFNIKGYEILFPDDKWFDFLSPFSILLFVTEFAVLVWTSNVIDNWPKTSRILKFSLFIVILSFFTLSFSGINSYLSNLATKDYASVQVDNQINSNNEQLVIQSQSALADIKQELEQLRQQRSEIIISIDTKNQQINKANTLASERRLKALDCNLVPDCKAAVDQYQDESNRINEDLKSLITQRNNLNNRIFSKESESDEQSKIINKALTENKINLDQNAGTQVSFQQKQELYANIVLKITGWFDWQPTDPFGVFINFVSGLIYPIYLLLNLYNALHSPANIAAREQRKSNKYEKKSKTHWFLRKILKYQRTYQLRKKRERNKNFASFQQQKRHQSAIMYRLIRYFRVWAHRRTKTRVQEVELRVEIPTIVEKEIEKIVEVPIEIEKYVDRIVEVEVLVDKKIEVIKEIPVEVRVEVPVEVDRIVKVDNDVPVYIDRIKEVPVPYFVPDPQILVHERIIPVPDGITGEQLEAILKAQPILNQEARAQQHIVSTATPTNIMPPNNDKNEVLDDVSDLKEALYAQS